MAAVNQTQWYAYMKEVYRILKPGGWIQCVEFNPWFKCDDNTLPTDSALAIYQGMI
jgi:ubiquinone/menaquinone biosynthesis C-methylase UbiE